MRASFSKNLSSMKQSRYLAGSSGFTLIEILVALVVLSIGLLGLAMLQVQGMRFTNESYLRTQATVLAYDIIDRMRANKTGADAGDYVPPGTTINGPPATIETCGNVGGLCGTTKELADYDFTVWYQRQTDVLPAAANRSSIRRDDTGPVATPTRTYTIIMRWLENGTEQTQSWILVI